MKTHYFLFAGLLLLLALGACSGSGPMGRNATGLLYEIVVTTDQNSWNGAVGKAVKDELLADVPGLPQSEPAFKITFAPPEQFNGLLTYVRNILIVKVDKSIYTKTTLTYERDRWANDLLVLTLTAPDSGMVVSYLQKNPLYINGIFSKEEMNRMVKFLQKEYSTKDMQLLKKNHKVMLNAPASMTSFRDTTDFFWTSNQANSGRMDIVVYTFPYTDPKTFTLEYLANKRDSVMKANIPGAFPDSYMTTERRFSLTYEPITAYGQYCGVMRGLWQMHGDMMGGPFVSHIRLDKKNNRIVVAEGFVYAPETDKRNFIRRCEASLYTLRLPEEFDKPVEKIK